MSEPQDKKNGIAENKSGVSKPHNADTAVDLEKHPHLQSLHSAIEPFMATSQKTKLVVGAIGAVVVVGVAIAALWYGLSGLGLLQDQDTQDDTAAVVTPQEEYVDMAFADIKGDEPIISTVTSLGGQTSEGTLLYDFAPYRSGDELFRSLPATGYGKAIQMSDAGSALSVFQLAHEVLTTQSDMTRMSENSKDAGGLLSQSRATLSRYATYRSDDTICSLAYLTGSGAHVVSIGCAAQAEYKKAADGARPFSEAYQRVNGAELTQKTVFGAPEVTTGKNGVMGATLYQKVDDKSASGGVYVYYRPSSENTRSWQLLGGGYMGPVPCGIFKTDEQKAAFATRTCYDDIQKKEQAL